MVFISSIVSGLVFIDFSEVIRLLDKISRQLDNSEDDLVFDVESSEDYDHEE